jgi:hypothetical protein
MGMWLNEALLLKPDLIEAGVRDLGRLGYGIVRPIMRNTNLNHFSPEMIEGISRMVKAAHEVGMRVVLDCEPHAEPLVHNMGTRFPEALGCHLIRSKTQLVNGYFTFHVPSPDVMGKKSEFLGVEAAFLRVNGEVRKLDSLRYDLSYEGEIFDVGFTTRDHYHSQGRAAARRMHSHLKGRLADTNEGELIIYVRYFDARLLDFWAEGTWKYFDLLLEAYRGIPLDGVGWDEPAVGGDWTNYLYGDGFAAAFERLNGYKLTDKLYLLDEPGMSPESAGVRLNYYHTLNEGVYEAQRRLIAKGVELFGPDLLTGTHHTWQGEGGINDYRAGAIDYFRLNDNMDAGYTDCCWWDPFSVSYAYTLASSLGRLTPTGEAEVNTWHWKPSNSFVEYNARLMTLMDITWFNLSYGETADTCRYPAHYTWDTTVRETQRHAAAQRYLGQAKPVIDIAILHGWESVTAINRADIACGHKAFCLNMSEILIDRCVAFDWVDTRLLSQGTVEGEKFTCALGSYSVVIIPYGTVLPRQAWNNLVAFARAGGRLIFTGPPPDLDTEGNSLREEFAELLGMAPLPLKEYLKGIDAVCTLPIHRPEKLDVTYPLVGDADRIMTSIENEPHGICSEQGNVVYLTDLDPRVRLYQVIDSFISFPVTCYSSTMLWRLYRDDEREIVALISRKNRTLRGVVRFAGKSFEFTDGLVAFLEKKGDELNVLGENIACTPLALPSLVGTRVSSRP